jgi:hypothetical protein
VAQWPALFAMADAYTLMPSNSLCVSRSCIHGAGFVGYRPGCPTSTPAETDFAATDSATGALLVLSASAPAEHCEVSPPPLPQDV